MKRFGIACLMLGMLLVGCASYEARQQQLAAEFRHPFIVAANGREHSVASYGDLLAIMRDNPGEMQTFILGELFYARYNQNLDRLFAGNGYREIEGKMLEIPTAENDVQLLYRQTFAKPKTNPDYNSGAWTNLGYQIWNVFH